MTRGSIYDILKSVYFAVRDTGMTLYETENDGFSKIR